MAERPSVSEILARVRAAGPARPAEEATSETPPPEPEATAAEPRPLEQAPAPAASAPPPPSPSSLGRPLSLKEKLAAARDRPAGQEPAAPAPPPAAAAAEAPAAGEPRCRRRGLESPPASSAPQLTPEALGRPLTLKEKLAAARAGGGSGAAPAAAAKPAARPAAGAAPAAAAKAASTRPLPPLEQMSDPKDLAEALRRAGAEKEKKAKADVAAKAGTTTKAAPKRAESKVVPPRPGRAAAEATPSAEPGVAAGAVPVATRPSLLTASRRQLMRVGFWIAAGWTAFTVGIGAFTAMSLRFMFPNVLAEPPSTIKVGLPTNFEAGEVNENWKAEWGFWIVRSDYYDGEDKIYALSTICTHLGCPPNWLPGEQKFKCPCHGSGYYVSGVNFEGPAPRPLERFKIAVGDDGQLLVDKSAKFQEELGQWTDPESFVKV